MRIPRVGIWTLIHYQEATEHRLSPDSNPLHACCCCKMDRVIKENTPQEPKPNNCRQHKFSEPLALSPRQLKRAQNRLKYEMNSEAWEWDKMNPVTEEPIWLFHYLARKLKCAGNVSCFPGVEGGEGHVAIGAYSFNIKNRLHPWLGFNKKTSLVGRPALLPAQMRPFYVTRSHPIISAQSTAVFGKARLHNEMKFRDPQLRVPLSETLRVLRTTQPLPAPPAPLHPCTAPLFCLIILLLLGQFWCSTCSLTRPSSPCPHPYVRPAFLCSGSQVPICRLE